MCSLSLSIKRKKHRDPTYTTNHSLSILVNYHGFVPKSCQLPETPAHHADAASADCQNDRNRSTPRSHQRCSCEATERKFGHGVRQVLLSVCISSGGATAAKAKELFLRHCARARSILDSVKANYTFINLDKVPRRFSVHLLVFMDSHGDFVQMEEASRQPWQLSTGRARCQWSS